MGTMGVYVWVQVCVIVCVDLHGNRVFQPVTLECGRDFTSPLITRDSWCTISIDLCVCMCVSPRHVSYVCTGNMEGTFETKAQK